MRLCEFGGRSAGVPPDKLIQLFLGKPLQRIYVSLMRFSSSLPCDVAFSKSRAFTLVELLVDGAWTLYPLTSDTIAFDSPQP